MMSKFQHAYMDYDGPRLPSTGNKTPRKKNHVEGEEDDDVNPLNSLLWMEGDSLAPPCGSSVSLVHAMLDFASVHSDDVLYDLGCGDGRVVLEALVKKHCCQCIGVEIEEELVERSKKLIEALPGDYKLETSRQDPKSPLTRIQVIHEDLRTILKELVQRVSQNDTDIHTQHNDERPYHHLPMPTIITLYLLPEGLAEIENDLVALLPHMRIVSCCWGLKSIRPIEEKEYYDRRTKSSTTLMLYTKECFERIKGFEYMLSVYHQGH